MLFLFILSPMALVLGLLFVYKHYRAETRHIGFAGARALATLPETRIADAQPGRVKFRGRAKGAGNVMSYFHRVPCIAHRMVTTTHEGSQYVGTRVVHTFRISREWQIFPFELNDGSGSVWIDPRGAVFDYETASPEDGSSVEEQYVRDGDTLVVIGEVDVRSDTGYRDDQNVPRVRFVKPPLVSWRSEPENLPKMAPPPVSSALVVLGLAGMAGAFWTGNGTMMLICAAASGLVGLLGAAHVARLPGV